MWGDLVLAAIQLLLRILPDHKTKELERITQERKDNAKKIDDSIDAIKRGDVQ